MTPICEHYEERAAICQHEVGMPREFAEIAAMREIRAIYGTPGVMEIEAHKKEKTECRA